MILRFQNHRISRVILYTFILTCYYLLSAIFPNVGYGDNQVAERIYPQVTMGLIGVYSLFLVLFNYKAILKSSICKPFFVYFGYAFVYVFLVIPGGSLFANFIYFLKLTMAIQTLFTLYVFLRDDYETAVKCIFFLYAVQFIYSFQSLLMDKFVYFHSHEIFNSNAGFNLIAAIPMTLIVPQKRLRAYVYIMLVVGCLFSGQRSAAVAALISFPLCLSYLRNSLRRSDIIVISLLGVIVLYPVLQIAIDNIMERMAADEKRGDIGSGRSIFWLISIKDFFSHDLLHLMFGNGYYSIQKMLGMKYGMAIEAHNGWIQNLYVYGIVGFILYVKTVFILIRKNKKVNRWLPEYHNILLICFIIFFVKCSTSHGNWDISVMPMGSLLALIAYRLRALKLNYRHDYDPLRI